MTIIRQHILTGAVNDAVTTSDGFDQVVGTITKVAGYDSGIAAEIGDGAYCQDKIAPGFIGMFVRLPSLPAAEEILGHVVTSTGSSVAPLTVQTDGTLTLWKGFASAETTSTAALTANTWARVEWDTSTATQALRIFLDPASDTPDETITGATSGATPAYYRYGNSWGSRSTGTMDLAAITAADDWPNMGASTPAPTRWMRIAGAWVAAAQSIRSGSTWAPAATTTITGVTSQATFPITLPATL